MKRIFNLLIPAILLVSCHHDNPFPIKTADVIYTETNNYHINQNGILAYRHNEDGTLTLLPGSPFLTNGTGIANPAQMLGPDDSDTQLKITEDGHYLLAVNSGSHTIAVFRIEFNGRLTPVPGSPFPSGGKNPVSIDVHDGYVYVVNKAQPPVASTKDKPNYTVFTLDVNGTLTPVPNSTVETTSGSSPAQALVSHNGNFVFGDDFLGFMTIPPVGTLRSFIRDKNSGKITPVPGTPYTIPETGGALGLWQHPYDDILYVGFPLAGKIGVYSIQSSGELSFKKSVAAGAAACWIRSAFGGNRLYVLNSGENTISMYNTADAASPQTMGKLTLKKSGPVYMAMGLPFTTSEPFAFEFSASEKYLYVVNQHTNPDFSIGNYNYLHVLNVKDDGSLDEAVEPLQLPVDNTYRPQGVAVHRVHVFAPGDNIAGNK